MTFDVEMYLFDGRVVCMYGFYSIFDALHDVLVSELGDVDSIIIKRSYDCEC